MRVQRVVGARRAPQTFKNVLRERVVRFADRVSDCRQLEPLCTSLIDIIISSV